MENFKTTYIMGNFELNYNMESLKTTNFLIGQFIIMYLKILVLMS